MKSLFLATLLASTQASHFAGNSVPLQQHQAGWNLGNENSDIELVMFYDLICSASAATDKMLTEVLGSTHSNGKTYREQLNFQVSAFPLPYHLHSLQVAQVVPYLDMLCENNMGCHHAEYASYSLENLDSILALTDHSTTEFGQWWGDKLHDKFGFNSTQIANLYLPDDHLMSRAKAVDNWKYAASMGTSGTPTLYINGVKLDSIPFTVEDWKKLLDDLIANQ